MKISFPRGINAGTGRRYRYLRIEIRPIYIKLWSWMPKPESEDDEVTYEVQPVCYVNGGVEMAGDSAADAWGVYRRLPPDEHGFRYAEWISDHPTEAEALEAKRLMEETP